eukprot:TRINITY_DN41713_c0_g1_i1.p1 TRINITY_DN41713_c0_g1~~TRINITY_DN41713_c0_g1_i1.p1  ORF type:complete len:213 (+),score=51.77 TRINITY_DN41713_c0_g1_i1:39-677(+)
MSEQALESLSEELAERFGSRSWESLRQCRLRVDGKLGAGLDLQFMEFGYQIDAVDEKPGQDKMQAGDVVVSLGGTPLVGLGEEEAEKIVERELQDGARVLLIAATELRQACVGRLETEDFDPSRDEIFEHGAMKRIPLGGSEWRMTLPALSDLRKDLVCLGEQFGILTEARLGDQGVVDSVVLSGSPEGIAEARPELVQILRYYKPPAQEDG